MSMTLPEEALASARAGFLDTNTFRARFEGGAGKYVICEHHTETLEHVIFECCEVLGMKIEIREGFLLDEDSMSEIMERTKRILERWERPTKDYSSRALRVNRR